MKTISMFGLHGLRFSISQPFLVLSLPATGLRKHGCIQNYAIGVCSKTGGEEAEEFQVTEIKEMVYHTIERL